MATNTYVALDKKTVSGTSTGTINLTAIPQNYTDLRIVFNGGSNIDSNLIMRYNGDSTSTLYSYTFITSDGTNATSGRAATANQIFTNYFGYMSTAFSTNINIDILNYSSTVLPKTNFSRANNTANGTAQVNGLWRSNSAITSIDLIASGNNFLNGTTVSLYGIAAEGVTPTPKATGGTIYDDSLYYYHVFGQTGVFTPTTSITADILVVAGGGAGGSEIGGGGGAGGLLAFTSQSLSATTYTCTVGGGAGRSSGTTSGGNGTNSTFQGLTAAVGGGGGGWYGANGVAGGSGGGGGRVGSGAASNASGQGFAGGNGQRPSGTGGFGGGGGGAGAVGQAGQWNGTLGTGGAGGIGATSSFINAIGSATNTGQTVSAITYFAGGGGGGGEDSGTGASAGGSGGGGNGAYNLTTGQNGVNATIYTGGGGGAGGGGSTATGGAGGSGIIVVRYLKA
jgi:hypothetical protein